MKTLGEQSMNACLGIYMSIHVSQLKEMPKPIRDAWEVGKSFKQDLDYEARTTGRGQHPLGAASEQGRTASRTIGYPVRW